MHEFQPGQFGKAFLIVGAVLMVTGAAVMLLGKAGLFRLPGDIELEGKHWKVYFPLMTCFVLSVILTLILWIVRCFRK